MTRHTEHLVRRVISRDIAKAINTMNFFEEKRDLNCNGLGFVYDCGYIADEYCVILGEMHKNPANSDDGYKVQ